MTFEPWIQELIPLSTVIIGFIAWNIRHEARTLANEKAISEASRGLDKLDSKVEALDNRIVEKLSFIERSLAKIEGRLSIDHEKAN